MALRLSAALRNAVLEGRSLKHEMSNAFLKVYTGAQPSTAEAAPTGTLLCTYSASSGAITRETLAVGSLTLATCSSGTIDTIKLTPAGPGTAIDILGGAVTVDGTEAGTATLCATAINDNPANIYVKASTTGSSGVITLTALPGTGATLNTWAVTGTETGAPAIGSLVDMAGGVAAVSGLKWSDAVAGVLSKKSTQTWSGVAAATGTAGWFRIEAAVTDSGALDSGEVYKRIDGSVATSGAELNLSSLSITNTATQSIDTFTLTLAAA